MNIVIESPNATSSYISNSQWRRLHDLEDQCGIEIQSIEQSDDRYRTIVDLALDPMTLCDIFGTQDEPSMQTLNTFIYSLVKILEDDASERL